MNDKVVAAGKEIATFVMMFSIVSTASLLGYMYGVQTNVITTHGSSMYPNITDSDVVLCNEKFRNLSVGDVAVYEKPNSDANVIHRVVWTNYSHYRFKGDNNEQVDPFNISRQRVHCKTVRVVRLQDIMYRGVDYFTK